MTTYILLRSNKESGPFNLDQLRQMGLKADDLVWVEGQSACWRNPHEIATLKDLVSAPVSPSPPNPSPQAVEKPVESPASAVSEKKTVFVALPGGNTQSQKPAAKFEEPQPDLIPEKKLPVEKPKEEVETKFSMSLDEIKERYIRSLNKKDSKKKKIVLPDVPPAIKKFAFSAGMFILGAVIVLLLVRPGRNTPVIAGENKVQESPGVVPAQDVTENAEDGTGDDVVLPESYYDSQVEGNTAAGRDLNGTGTTPQRPKNIQPPVADSNDEEDMDPAENEHVVSTPQNEEPEIRTNTPVDISGQLSVKANSYTVAALGGIRDLELTLNNGSDFTLDKVIVEVRYLSPNGNIVKTENIHFRSIYPNGSQTIGVKKTNRGVKVSYHIIKVESKEVDLNTAGVQ